VSYSPGSPTRPKSPNSHPRDQGARPTPVSSTDTITWDSTIKSYSLPVDVQCMIQIGDFDLSKKEDMNEHANDIYRKTKNKSMPKQMST
jgi:hypothetical protein